MKDKEYIFVDNYGELLAQVNGMELVSFEEDGGYQGKYIAILKSAVDVNWDGLLPERLFYYVGSYGSCSGCDWLEDKGNDFDYSGETEVYAEKVRLGKRFAVKYLEAVEYCGDIKAKFIVPATKPLIVVTKGEYEGFDIN